MVWLLACIAAGCIFVEDENDAVIVDNDDTLFFDVCDTPGCLETATLC